MPMGMRTRNVNRRSSAYVTADGWAIDHKGTRKPKYARKEDMHLVRDGAVLVVRQGDWGRRPIGRAYVLAEAMRIADRRLVLRKGAS